MNPLASLGAALVLSLALVPQVAWANRGHIPYEAGVTLFEPRQRAMIAWNGREELLVLSTDLRASAKTRVLEVLPCPAEPRVEKGSLRTFIAATRVINRHLLEEARKRGGGGRTKRAVDKAPPAGEVTFHDKIGAHDVSVTRVLSAEGFVEWVEGALAKEGVSRPELPPWASSAVKQYIDSGFEWFVFDSIEVDSTLRTAEPLRYRFKTSRLYYPLRITKVAGPSNVELLILTRGLLKEFVGLPEGQVRLRHRPFSLSASELREIDEEMAELLGGQPGTKLRLWNLYDRGGGFDADLLAR